jgi:hypothetical protein
MLGSTTPSYAQHMNVDVVNQCLASVVPVLRGQYNLEQNSRVTLLRQPGDAPHIFVVYESGGKTFVDMHWLQLSANAQPPCSTVKVRRAELLETATWTQSAPSARAFTGGTCPQGQSILDLPASRQNIAFLENLGASSGVQNGPIRYSEVLSLQQTGAGALNLLQSSVAANNLCVQNTRDLGALVVLEERLTGQCDGTTPDGNYPCRIISQGPYPAGPRLPGSLPRLGGTRPQGGFGRQPGDPPAVGLAPRNVAPAN